MIWVYFGFRAYSTALKTKAKPVHIQFKPVVLRLCLSEKSNASNVLIATFEL
jgi:hypothetical protein